LTVGCPSAIDTTLGVTSAASRSASPAFHPASKSLRSLLIAAVSAAVVSGGGGGGGGGGVEHAETKSRPSKTVDVNARVMYSSWLLSVAGLRDQVANYPSGEPIRQSANRSIGQSVNQ